MQQKSTFGVILDNTTFLKAGSILFPDFPLYTGLSMSRERQNLSNFIEALVLHDKVFLDRHSLEIDHPMVKSLLGHVTGIIKWQDFSMRSRPEILKQSRELAETRGTQGLFIEIIKQVPREFWQDYYRDEIRTYWPTRDYLGLIFEGISIIDDYLKPEMANSIDHHYSNEMFLSKFPNFFPPGFAFEWEELDFRSKEPTLYNVLLPIISLIIRGYFHLITSIEMGIPYWPLAARAPFIQHELYYSESRRVCMREVLLREFEKIRSELSSQANQILQTRIFETEIPTVLGYVLKKSKGRDEILNRTLELRESKNLVQYRRFCEELQQRLISEEVKPGEIIKIRNELGDIARKVTAGTSNLEKISISVGIPFSVSLGLPITGWGRKRGLLFLSDLQAVTRNIQSLEPEFERLNIGRS